MEHRIQINEYLYLVYTMEDGKVKVVYDRGVRKSTYGFFDVGDKYWVRYCDKIVGVIDKKTGEFKKDKKYIPTIEVKNHAIDEATGDDDSDFRWNRELFNSEEVEDYPYPLELHTHFMEVLSDEEFLSILGIKEIPVLEDGTIACCMFDQKDPTKIIFMDWRKRRVKDSDIKMMDVKDALRNPQILEQLRLPLDRQVPFGGLSERLAKRNALLRYSIKIITKRVMEHSPDKKIENVEKEIKTLAYFRMLRKALMTLDEQGVKYVEFSFSNSKTIRDLLDKVREKKLKVGEIEFRFLYSAHRNNKGGSNNSDKGRNYKDNVKILADLMKSCPEVVGFDLMGFEQEIDLERDTSDKGVEVCENLHGKLEFAIRQLLDSGRTRPTLRLHSGEIFYKDGKHNNNPLEILKILKSIEKKLKLEKGESFSLGKALSIRIGHGLHFKDEPEYYELLKEFDVIVEICASSNFALGNITDLTKLPFDKYIKNKIPVVIGTDGGGFYLTSLKGEAKLVALSTNDTLYRRFKGELVSIEEQQKIKTKVFEFDDEDEEETGLDMSYTVDKFIKDYKDNEFIDEYKKAEDKKMFVTEFFVVHNEYLNDKSLRKELAKTQAFYHDLIINESYFDSSEDVIIIKTFRKVQSLIDKKDFIEAAILLVSLQAVMGCQTKLDKVVFLMKEYDLDFVSCLTASKRKKTINIEVYGNEKTYDYIMNIFKETDRSDPNYKQLVLDYVDNEEYRLDNPEKRYFSSSDSEKDKVYKEIDRIGAKVIGSKSNYSKEQYSFLIEKINMALEYLNNNEIMKAAVAVVCLQEILHMDIRLELAKLYKDADGYGLSDFMEQDEIIFKHMGGKKL